MRFNYFIKEKGIWIRVDFKTYSSFDGEKKKELPMAGLRATNRLLLPFRYNARGVLR